MFYIFRGPRTSAYSFTQVGWIISSMAAPSAEHVEPVCQNPAGQYLLVVTMDHHVCSVDDDDLMNGYTQVHKLTPDGAFPCYAN